MGICLGVGNNSWKRLLIPHIAERWKNFAPRWAHAGLASWWGNGSPRQRSLAGLRGWPATLELRHGPDSYGRQQWGILDNGRKPDPATPRGWLRPSGCKALSVGKMMTVPTEEAPANFVPAAAVIRRELALLGIIGRKACVGCFASWKWKPRAQPWNCFQNYRARISERIAELLV